MMSESTIMAAYYGADFQIEPSEKAVRASEIMEIMEKSLQCQNWRFEVFLSRKSFVEVVLLPFGDCSFDLG